MLYIIKLSLINLLNLQLRWWSQLSMQICEFMFTARFARVTEDAEDNNFPLPLRGRQWKSIQQLTLQKGQKASILWLQIANLGILLPEGLIHFAFRRLSEKQKKPKHLRSSRLCGE